MPNSILVKNISSDARTLKFTLRENGLTCYALLSDVVSIEFAFDDALYLTLRSDCDYLRECKEV